eukprot:CAMPEP_0183324096 /NCGR_PEP_ID=MMETSP0160_2-20130417/76117_1 /TAXON_ID=2839 ORGANISM="Odontella Sinensis, Strain Grunow 1884" /NCGR_SAMPLE_ID=MMETSP0160_2 /ASSEMBLY_ACC=CAM_ASM_000250 /LENGTH=285 /DNA_ID=CAMNT_0025491611 /DNA_START=47 /DNA_END=900 /DNA_ORIENTATION=+
MPTSGQAPAGASKAAKFAAANPLGPMADPFAGLDDDQKEYHKAMSENVNERLTKAMEELRDKHASGTNELDDLDRAPTGAAYREVHRAQAERAGEVRRRAEEEEARKRREAEEVKMLREEVRRRNFGGDGEEEDDGDDGSDSDSDYDDLLEDDPELEAIRDRRLEQMRSDQVKRAENLAKGHGQLRTIGQDDFLPECTGTSEWVAVHFFSDDFERCRVMDKHLTEIAQLHPECKFLRIDANRAPFFVAKLKVRTLPALLVFREGKAVDRLTGFEGLAPDPAEPDR